MEASNWAMAAFCKSLLFTTRTEKVALSVTGTDVLFTIWPSWGAPTRVALIVGWLARPLVVHCLSHVVVACCVFIWAIKFFLAVSRSCWRIAGAIRWPPPVVGWLFETVKARSEAGISL